MECVSRLIIMKEEIVMPPIRMSKSLFEALEDWRSKRVPIPTKTEAVRILLKKALEDES
jgi:hypothetical protein